VRLGPVGLIAFNYAGSVQRFGASAADPELATGRDDEIMAGGSYCSWRDILVLTALK